MHFLVCIGNRLVSALRPDFHVVMPEVCKLTVANLDRSRRIGHAVPELIECESIAALPEAAVYIVLPPVLQVPGAHRRGDIRVGTQIVAFIKAGYEWFEPPWLPWSPQTANDFSSPQSPVAHKGAVRLRETRHGNSEIDGKEIKRIALILNREQINVSFLKGMKHPADG